MIRSLYRRIRAARDDRVLPHAAKQANLNDLRYGLQEDPGIDAAVAAAFEWLATAQDCSASHDGGVARDFSLVNGWATSYPETTGYIIPTLLDRAVATGDELLRERAQRMLDWLVAIQFPEGGFQGGRVEQTPRVPVTFNTGQILLGLAAGVKHLGERYREPMVRAAQWLATTQDPDGCWRRHETPFASAGEKAYETHVSWGLFEAERVHPGALFGAAGLRQVDWALTKQRPNGWFASNCLTEPHQPLTHTIGYVLRGVLEAYLLSRDPKFLEAARRCADGVLGALEADGRLPGRLDASWSAGVDWVCLTGTVQIAHCWLLLYRETGDARYLDAARRANRYVRRTVSLTGPAETRGGVKGSFPVGGDYGRFEYLNWACKFFIDSNLLEQELS